MDDPRKDGWDIEAFNQKATETLQKLRALLEEPAVIGAQRLSALVTKTFVCTPLLPNPRKVVFDGDGFSIERATLAAEAASGSDASSSHQGVAGLEAALNTLMGPFADAKNIHCKFKLFRATPGEAHVTTEQYVAVSGRTPQGVIEQNATWRIRWQYSDNQTPKIENIAVIDFEQVTRNDRDGALYADCTQSILDGNPCYERQFLRGRNHWLNQSQDTRYTYLLGNPGLAVGDVNGDGLDDLYACQEEGLPNRLFLQQPDGTAKDVSESWGVNWLHNSRSALIVDLDNDGDQDLIVAMVGGIVTASNDGQKFTIRSILPTDEDLMSLCAADYDQDADLDIYVCAYNGNEGLSATTRGGLIGGAIASNSFDRPNGGRNTLFRNDIADAEWQFTDVTREAQLDKELRPLSLAAAWDDFDNDGDPDLYVANDYGNNQLFRNDDGVFVEATQTTRATDRGFGMSVTWGDYDRNGLMDVYVSNMFSAAG
ncbi:MAG: VCBS repeat-containing protein, partial [Planctomycetaceae bacterium]